MSNNCPKKNSMTNINIDSLDLKNVDGVINTENFTLIGWNSKDNHSKEINLDGVEFFLRKEKQHEKKK